MVIHIFKPNNDYILKILIYLLNFKNIKAKLIFLNN